MNKIKMYIVATIPYTGEYDIKSVAPCIDTIEFRFGYKIIPFGFDDWECEIDKNLNSVVIGWQSGKSFLKSDGISEVYRDDILDVGIDPDKITAEFLSKPDEIVRIHIDIAAKSYYGNFINIGNQVSIEAITFVDENHTPYNVSSDKISQFNRKDTKPVEIVYKYIPCNDVISIIDYSNTNDDGITTSRYGGNFTIEEGIYYSSVKQLVVNSTETLEFGGHNTKYYVIKNNGEIDYRTVSRILVFVENLSTNNTVDKSAQIITKIVEYFPSGVRIEMLFGRYKDRILNLFISPSDYISIVGADPKSMKLVNLLYEEDK